MWPCILRIQLALIYGKASVNTVALHNLVLRRFLKSNKMFQMKTIVFICEFWTIRWRQRRTNRTTACTLHARKRKYKQRELACRIGHVDNADKKIIIKA